MSIYCNIEGFPIEFRMQFTQNAGLDWNSLWIKRNFSPQYSLYGFEQYHVFAAIAANTFPKKDATFGFYKPSNQFSSTFKFRKKDDLLKFAEIINIGLDEETIRSYIVALKLEYNLP